MKKANIFVQEKDASACIAKLRTLGILHIEHQRAPLGQDISTVTADLALLDHTVTVLSQDEFSNQGPGDKKDPADWKTVCHHIIDMHKRLEQLLDYSRTLKSGIDQWQAWGDLDPEAIKGLSSKNIFVRLYQIPAKELKNLPGNLIVKKISLRSGMANCAVISRGKIELAFKELSLPKTGLKKMQARLKENMHVAGSIRNEIIKHVSYLDGLLETRKLLEKELEFHQARLGMGQEGVIAYLTGFAPYDATGALFENAKKEQWGLLVADPAEEDNIPTLIRNPRWISIIEPVFKVIDVVPGYKEFDTSLLFLIFLSVFFGILIGDAGYGALFMIMVFLAKEKWGRRIKDKTVFPLLYLFSFCAIVWGVLSGTFFGQEWLPQSIKPLVPALREDRSMQVFCFFLGALHLSIGRLWRIIRQLPSLTALAEIGWMLILWGGFFLAKTLILGDAFPYPGRWLFIGGCVLVVGFTSVRVNLFKGIGAGLANLAMNLVNAFTDVVSYIRLFAVGLASVAVADAFNKMAIESGYNSLLAGAISVFILLLGHLLNILLGPMAVLVHGVRLNVLEFSNHLDLKWSGFAYRPFKEPEGGKHKA